MDGTNQQAPSAEDMAIVAVAVDETVAELEQQADLEPTSAANNNNTVTNTEEEVLNRICAAFTEAFPVTNEIIYESTIDLKDRMNEMAKLEGFLCICGPGQITCSKGRLFKSQTKQLADKKSKTPIEKQRKSSSIKCGCKFGCRVAKLDKASRLLHPDAPEKAIRIISASFMHTNGCSPSSQQLNQAKKRSGVYTRNVLTRDNLASLIHMNRFGKCDRLQIRGFLQELLPMQTAVNAIMIANVRLRLQRLKSKPAITTEDAESFSAGLQSDANNNIVSLDDVLSSC